MPLFGNKSSANDRTADRSVTPPLEEDRPKRKSGLFGRRRDSSPNSPTRNHTTSPTTNEKESRGSFFSRDRTSTGGSGGLGGHRHTDPSIHAAQERVRLAERAELEADKALHAAKNAVREARDHVKRLEREAAEEARLAKIKQGQAKSLSKSARNLGRHDHV